MSEFRLADVPTVARSGNEHDCLLASMYSILHSYDPGCPLRLEHLHNATRSKLGVGVDMLHGTYLLNVFGLCASMLASSKDRIPAQSFEIKNASMLFMEAQLRNKQMREWMLKGHRFICGIMPEIMYEHTPKGTSHAVAVTGFTDDEIIYHENAAVNKNDGHGLPHHTINDRQFEAARYLHDFQTIVIWKARPTFKERAAYFAKHLSTAGAPHA